jgi:hypothetical protein
MTTEKTLSVSLPSLSPCMTIFHAIKGLKAGNTDRTAASRAA